MARCGTDLQTAVDLLQAGRPVGLPTETVYGLAARADMPDAVADIYRLKGRPAHNPLILHFSSVADMRGWVARMPTEAERLFAQFSPGPLTLLLPKGPRVGDHISAGLPRVGVRIPAHPLFRKAIQRTGCPLAAPSANRSGYVSPTLAEHVAGVYGGELTYVLDGGPCEVGVESTIVGLEPNGSWTLYRPGAIAATDIECVLDAPLRLPHDHTQVVAPGMDAHHYAPHTPVLIGLEETPVIEGKEGWITWRELTYPIPAGVVHHPISNRSDLNDAARELYAAMIRLDGLGLDRIRIQPFPHRGIGIALNERIHRASLRTHIPEA